MKLAFVAPVSLRDVEQPIAAGLAVPATHASSWVMTLIAALEPHDVELSVLTVSSTIARDMEFTLHSASIQVMSIQVPLIRRGLGLGSPQALFALPVARLVARIRQLQPDLVHGHGTEGPFSLAALASGGPNVISLQGIMEAIAPVDPTLHNRFAVHSERWTLRRAKHVHVKSSFSVEHLRRSGFAGTTHHVEPAIHERFWSAPVPAPRQRIVTVGSMMTRKGIGDLLHAMAELARQGHSPQVDLVGSGPQRGEFEALASQLGLGAAVTFHGELAPESVHQLLAKGGVFVLPSHIENSPNSIMEAMATGLPVVATDAGSVRDIVDSGVTGVVVPCQDQRQLASVIGDVLSNAQQAQDMGSAGRTVAQSRWHPDRVVPEMLSMYEAVLSDSR